MSEKVRIGVVGTSWWADAMYLPALTRHPLADVRGVVGSRPEHTREFAARWGVPGAYDTLETMLDAEPLDALVILSPNRHHVPMAMAAIERGLHVLCEKPLGMSSSEAKALVEAAERAGVITMTPFTYRFMPMMRYLKELVDEGYLGRPYHLDMRYYISYGRGGEYLWRFDLDEAGSGTGGDLGSHWAYLVRSFYGEIAAVTAVFGYAVPRAPRPYGADYPRGEDSAMILLEFENGATGSLQVSSVATSRPRSGSVTPWSCTAPRARSMGSATGTASSASTAAASASPSSTSCRSPTGSSAVLGGTRSTTPTGTRSASRTSRRARSSPRWPTGRRPSPTSATGSRCSASWTRLCAARARGGA